VEVKSNPAFFELANPVFAWTVENLAKKNNVVNLSRTKRKFELLQDFNCIPLPTKAKIDVLIGADYHELMQNLEVISSNKSDHLWAVKMLLGWTCLGPNESRFHGDALNTTVHSIIINDWQSYLLSFHLMEANFQTFESNYVSF
jgi:hypothetical protein